MGILKEFWKLSRLKVFMDVFDDFVGVTKGIRGLSNEFKRSSSGGLNVF